MQMCGTFHIFKSHPKEQILYDSTDTSYLELANSETLGADCQGLGRAALIRRYGLVTTQCLCGVTKEFSKQTEVMPAEHCACN